MDPQTSGGLIAGVPEARAETVLAALRDGGAHFACVIGRVADGLPGRISFRQ